MRSWRFWSNKLNSVSLREFFTPIAKRVPLSIRRICVKPQLCKISVALLDQGDIVPGRGITNRLTALCWPSFIWSAGFPYLSNRLSCADSAATKPSSQSTKWTNCACRSLTFELEACRVQSNFEDLKADRAAAPNNACI